MLLPSWIESLRLRLRKPRSRRRPQRATGSQALETRALLTVATTFGATVAGHLDVASDADDAIVISQSEGTVTVNGTSTGVAAADVLTLEVDGGAGGNLIDLRAVNGIDFPNLTAVEVDGGLGNDTIFGSALGDNLDGDAGNDVIHGGGGNDTIDGADGNDRLNGSAGDDVIRGGRGRDRLRGQGGHDHIEGGDDTDRLIGGAGDDNIMGGGGRDRLRGVRGDDNLDGGDGNDVLLGGSGRDRLRGGNGNDRLRGQGGSGDTLTGGMGDDLLDGGGGQDRIAESGDTDFTLTSNSLSGMGNDTIRGIENARITGGASANTIDASGFDGSTTISGGAGNDTVTGGTGTDSINGDLGDDSVNGGAGDDTVNGGDGNDSIDGADGDDSVSGGAGDDSLGGAAGDDSIEGGAGDDSLDGADGDDSISGGADDDIVSGGNGADDLNGDDGNDLIDRPDDDDNVQNGIRVDLGVVYIATLTPASGSLASGDAEFKQSVDEDVEMEFEVEVEDAAPGTYDVLVNGTVIGQLTVDALGDGELNFSTDPDDVDESPLPANFPEIIDGTTVEIQGIASGTFSPVPIVRLEGDFTADASVAGASGDIRYKQRPDETELRIEVEGLAEGSYEVRVNTFLIASIDIDNKGEGDLRLEADDQGSSDFPNGFPGITSGDTVTVGGNLLTITF